MQIPDDKMCLFDLRVNKNLLKTLDVIEVLWRIRESDRELECFDVFSNGMFGQQMRFKVIQIILNMTFLHNKSVL